MFQVEFALRTGGSFRGVPRCLRFCGRTGEEDCRDGVRRHGEIRSAGVRRHGGQRLWGGGRQGGRGHTNPTMQL